MRKGLILIFIVFLASPFYILKAQNYQLIFPREINYFRDSSGLVRTIKIDSINFNGKDSIFYNYRSIDIAKINKLDSLPYHKQFCINAIDTSWLGIKVIKRQDGSYLFFNARKDTILLKPLVKDGEKWIVWKSSEQKIYGEVIKKENTLLKGIEDTIITAKLYATDLLGNAINSPINNKLIRWSKRFGFILIFDFYHFPQSFISYSRSKMDKIFAGKSPLDFYSIYDFNIGDEFHYVTQISGTTYYKIQYRKQIILEKKIYEDSIVYTDSIVSIDGINYSEQRQKVVYKYLQFSQENNLPFQKPINDTFINGVDFVQPTYTRVYDTSSFHGRPVKLMDGTDFKPNENYNCLLYERYARNETTVRYGLGLGTVEAFTHHGSLSGAFREYLDKLIYYKKGTEVYGSPIVTCDVFPPVPQISRINDSLNFFPNIKTKIQWFVDSQLIKEDTLPTVYFDEYKSYNVKYYLYPCLSKLSNKFGPRLLHAGPSSVDDATPDYPLLNIFPNPSKGNFKIILLQNEYLTGSVKIYNIMGQLINTSLLKEMETEINLTAYSKGLYLLEINIGNKQFIKKVIID